MEWKKHQIYLHKKIYTKNKVESRLQLDNSFLDEKYYHYLISSLGLIYCKNSFTNGLGLILNKNKIKGSTNYIGSIILEDLNLESALACSSDVMLIKAKDIDEESITLVYCSDLIIRCYLNEQEISPLLLGYKILSCFISNLNLNGFVLIDVGSCSLTTLGLVLIKGVVGRSENISNLKAILNND